MFSKKGIWAFLTLMIVMSLILAACAPGTETEAVVVPETNGEQPTEEMAVEPTEEMAVEPTEEMAVEPTEEMAAEPTEEMAAEPTEEGAAAGEGEQIGGVVNFLGVWGGEELTNFEAMIAPFEEQTGVDVQFEGTRDVNAVLTTRVQGGNPPDIAGLPGPGQLQQFAEEGALVPLNDVIDLETLREQYDPGFVDLAMADDQLYGIFMKASVKSLVWYSPPQFEANGYEVPTTWEEMNALEQQIIEDGFAPWCIGFESGAASGWPGTDWIEDIMLRTAGPDIYDQWWQHEIEWTAEPIAGAWQTWGEVVGDPEMVYGGPNYMLTTPFGEAAGPLFTDPPQCMMHRQASFITTFIEEQYPDLEPGTDYNFFIFPPIDEEFGNPLLVAGDLVGMFNDTPQARALMQYLVTPEAQEIWAAAGGFIAPNREVPPDVYPDELSQQVAEELASASAVRFDASDLMPEAVNNAFWSGILEFVQNPDALDSILENIESTAQEAYPSE